MKSGQRLTIIILSLLSFAKVNYGQKTVSFPNISTIVDTAHMQLKTGNHKIIIRYSVNRKVSYDTVSVTIYPDSTRYHINQLPYADAGLDKTVPLGITAKLNGGGYDPDGRILKYYWKKIAGSNYGKISYPYRKVTTLTNLIRKTTYIFRLTVTDDKGGTSFDDVEIIVQ